MRNLYSEPEAEAAVVEHAQRGVGRDLALRVYTTRLLGGEPRLVLHGGGNTSVKTTRPDLLGRNVEVMCVKGSGWDMAVIEPEGLPAVRLEPLRELLADERSGAGRSPREYGASGPTKEQLDELVPKFDSPSRIHIVVAGSEAGKFTSIFPGWASEVASRAIEEVV